MASIALNFYNFLDLLPTLIAIPCNEDTHLKQTPLQAMPLMHQSLGAWCHLLLLQQEWSSCNGCHQQLIWTQ